MRMRLCAQCMFSVRYARSRILIFGISSYAWEWMLKLNFIISRLHSFWPWMAFKGLGYVLCVYSSIAGTHLWGLIAAGYASKRFLLHKQTPSMALRPWMTFNGLGYALNLTISLDSQSRGLIIAACASNRFLLHKQTPFLALRPWVAFSILC